MGKLYDAKTSKLIQKLLNGGYVVFDEHSKYNLKENSFAVSCTRENSAELVAGVRLWNEPVSGYSMGLIMFNSVLRFKAEDENLVLKSINKINQALFRYRFVLNGCRLNIVNLIYSDNDAFLVEQVYGQITAIYSVLGMVEKEMNILRSIALNDYDTDNKLN